ncbi:hypothetical protein EDD21DRAFT_351373 [Dissophora ornata]|nr:hypothetical protein EDD21DRAFT_351373 [Dissophora ornata]
MEDSPPRESLQRVTTHETLSWCPLLKEHMGRMIDTVDLLDGWPWDCSRISRLETGFDFSPPVHDKAIQRLVFERMSRLMCLEKLSLDIDKRSENYWHHCDFEYIIDLVTLSLEKGLLQVV